MANVPLYIGAEQLMALASTVRYLYRYAFIDLMTGLKNRNAYEEELKSLRSDQKQLEGLRVVMIDINGMKKINDNYGHNRGDEAIKIVGRCLAEAFGDKGFCARYGGDEFVGLFHFDVSENIAKLNRLIKLEGYSVEYPLSVSIGIAEYDPVKDDGIDSLVRRCDTLMYMRKKAKTTDHCKFQRQVEAVV